MRKQYMDLETGKFLSAKDLLSIEDRKGAVWEAADELRSLLEDIATSYEEEAQTLLIEAQHIREYLEKYNAAEEALDRREVS
jgi:uncharacterized protein YPO0396